MNQNPPVMPQPTSSQPLQPQPEPAGQFQQTPPKKSNTGLIVGIIIAIVIIPLIIWGILASMITVSLSSARTKAQDAQVKSEISQMRTSAEMYASANIDQSYVGFDKSQEFQTINDAILSSGTSVVVQNLTAKTYLMYAKLPSSGTFWCVDSLGNSLELTGVAPTLKTCK